MNNLEKLFMLRPDVVFLNHGSFGACPHPVFDAYQRWQVELERQPVEFIQRRLNGLMADARHTLAQYLGVAENDLVYVTNATTAVNIVARSLRLEPGDEVLATDHEYGSMDRTWELVCRRTGASYLRQSIKLPAASPEEVVEQILQGVNDRTRVLFFSHITSNSAFILPAEELIRRAHEAGLIVVVDGAHAAGQIDLDLSALGADFYAGNCHKWMMAPKGSGFLYARREVQSLLEPLIGGSSPSAQPEDRFVVENQYQGTRDCSAFLSVPTAIAFMEEHNWDAVRQSCFELVAYARHRTEDMFGLPQPTPNTRQWFSQMACLRIPPCDSQVLKKRLLDEYSIEVPTTRWNDQTYVRISVQGYNSHEQIDCFLNALHALISKTT